MKTKSILIIGILPPPIGGVTIHLQRLLKALEETALRFKFVDYRKNSKYDTLKMIFKADIIHTNFSNKLLRLIVTLILRISGKKVIITFHGKYTFENLLDFWSLRLSNYNFVLNHFTYNQSIKILSKKTVGLISAFIPPSDNEQLSLTIQNNIKDVSINTKKIVCTNAHTFVIDKEGKDLYGIDFALRIFSNLKDYCLIISDPSGKLVEKYVEYNQFRNILFISEPHSFVEIIKKSDIYIRTTTTDGDSLSVKEALYFRKKVVASDCVDRPRGSIIYKTHDSKSFILGLENSSTADYNLLENGADSIIKVYNSIANC